MRISYFILLVTLLFQTSLVSGENSFSQISNKHQKDKSFNQISLFDKIDVILSVDDDAMPFERKNEFIDIVRPNIKAIICSLEYHSTFSKLKALSPLLSDIPPPINN